MENNSSGRDNLTLDERFNMFELTADLKKLCPGVKREYFTYQPMTDDIYNKWERTQALRFMELQHLDIDDNVSKSNEQADPMNGHDPNRMIKVPVSSFYSISPLLLRKDIAAIVTDNISTEGTAAASAAAVIHPKDIAKCNDAPLLLPAPMNIKPSENYRKALSKKKASIMRTKRRLLSAYNCHLLDSDSPFDTGGQSQTPFYLRSKISTPGFWATNFLFDKEKAWNMCETQMVNSKSTKDFSDC